MAFLPHDLTPPPYWWLLLLACLGQGFWAAVLGLARLRGKRVAAAAHWPGLGFGIGFGAFVAGALCGLAYGWVQSDAVFVLGQACALGLGLLWARAVNKERKNER